MLRQDPKDVPRTVWRPAGWSQERVGVKGEAQPVRGGVDHDGPIGHSEHCGFCQPVTGCEQVYKGSIQLLC